MSQNVIKPCKQAFCRSRKSNIFIYTFIRKFSELQAQRPGPAPSASLFFKAYISMPQIEIYGLIRTPENRHSRSVRSLGPIPLVTKQLAGLNAHQDCADWASVCIL